VDQIAGLGARGMAFRLSPGQQHSSMTITVGNPDIVIAVDRRAPGQNQRPAVDTTVIRFLIGFLDGRWANRTL
jgi:hypothetical protein